ncbi:MAG TPA: YpdA family putative bacillithiol disulfide reductase [Saprospiraceae bacterium]|nr:YpdA family putative bacillithiol disulfide reductase [Saprospiraceae bacterium]HMP24340.1 YpdA family putative bacillithiol disulfide reductase [Saprospiraceae bacterium]
METFDLVIIGGGPTGLNCAISAEKAGLSYVVLEKGALANSIYHFPVNMTFFSTSRLLEIGGIPFISHSDKPTRREALEYYRRIWQSWHLKVRLYEEVLQMQATGTGWYHIETAKGHYKAAKVIVATGFYDTPRLLKVPGESLPKVKHYYDDAHIYVGQKILVVGAANSACDVALETYYKGAEVTMAIRESEIYPKVKYWIRPNIENRIKEGSIKAHFNTVVREIRPQEVVLEGPEGLFTIENNFVLAMTGYQPNYALLERLGIEVPAAEPRIPVYNEETLETSLPGVYLAGVVCAGMQTNKLFIENTRDHGDRIIKEIQAQKAMVH